MTNKEFLYLINNPQNVEVKQLPDLKEMVDNYPFFVQARLLYAKALLNDKNIHAEKQIKLASLYCSDKHWFYYYLFPEKKPLSENQQHERVPKFTGTYFDLLENIGNNGEDISKSLKSLAVRLKEARQMVMEEQNQNPPQKPAVNDKMNVKVEFSLPDYYRDEVKNELITEEQAKKYILEKKYPQAIEILKKLNLINPKKSVYFADQIRFLEKVIANSKK